LSETEQILRNLSVSTEEPIKLYSLYLGSEIMNESALTLLTDLRQYLQYFMAESTVESSYKATTFSLFPERREPIHTYEEIDTEKWKEALLYEKAAADDLVQKILMDFDIDQNSNNVEWFYKQMDEMLSNYEAHYDVQLPEETRSMLKNLMIRMVYDKLCINTIK
jgi:hypothetical protein